MAKQFRALDANLSKFILEQKVFFVASATAKSRVNMSPREIGCLRILSDQSVAYLDRTGSGNETAAHVVADGRLTIMLCAFEGPPRIIRLYGSAKAFGWQTGVFSTLIQEQYDGVVPLGTRQIITLDIELVQTSCGNGVPLFEYRGERQAIDNWHNALGVAGLKKYWAEKNLHSIDGLPTGLVLPEPEDGSEES